ncbi:hypothetical protein BDN72DRAFT_870233 [Pluteus cervinus]|uniref:Uncharacterized protein n=1 Tax=Pluteus cervinus TaxID=181527 RepID=A0ACD3AYD4_9AGAR|nr:hypothetical protein BDN72DRAFT_870233 [Pluteus cervinus]
MQRATCTGIRIRSPADARVIFHAVLLNILPMVTRRLDTEERGLISPGSVYVWEERGPHAELTGVGIERWTDGIRWGPSRVREGFLFYHEKQDTQQHAYSDGNYDNDSPSTSNHDPSRTVLIKQTYTVFVDTMRGQRKWHLIAYFTEDSIERLRSIDDIPQLANLGVPHGKYKSARCAKGRPDHIFNPEPDNSDFGRIEYVPYTPAPRRDGPLQSVQTTHPPLVWMDLSRMTPTRRAKSSSVSSSENSPGSLAPLAYLQNIPPPRRHPIDEKALKLFSSSAGLL